MKWSLIAAAALLGSAGLQLAASLTRWVTLRDPTGESTSMEDHLFDYTFPSKPWESLGQMALQYGAGLLLVSVAVLAMFGAADGRGSVRRSAPDAVGVLGVAVVAACFALTGQHALISGLTGVPAYAENLFLLLDLPALFGLTVLAVHWWRRARAISAACVLLLALTLPGLLVSSFVIAPMIAGYQSHDTTPWTETISAAATGAAGLVMLINASALTPPRLRTQATTRSS